MFVNVTDSRRLQLADARPASVENEKRDNVIARQSRASRRPRFLLHATERRRARLPQQLPEHVRRLRIGREPLKRREREPVLSSFD